MNNYMIHKALDKKLEQFAQAANVPVAWENTPFTPPVSGVYLESDFLPADNEDFTVQGSATLRRGLYQVTVVYPVGSGTQAAEKLASAVSLAFSNNTALPTEESPVYINGEPSVFSGIRDGTAYRMPVSIAYVVTA